MRALLIEDEVTLARALQRRLREECEVEVANTGGEGLRKATSGGFDVVFVDLSLPDVEGIDVCRRLRFVARDLPVFVMTGRLAVDVEEVTDAGAREVIQKSPHLLDDLVAALHSAVPPRAA